MKKNKLPNWWTLCGYDSEEEYKEYEKTEMSHKIYLENAIMDMDHKTINMYSEANYDFSSLDGRCVTPEIDLKTAYRVIELGVKPFIHEEYRDHYNDEVIMYLDAILSGKDRILVDIATTSRLFYVEVMKRIKEGEINAR